MEDLLPRVSRHRVSDGRAGLPAEGRFPTWFDRTQEYLVRRREVLELSVLELFST